MDYYNTLGVSKTATQDEIKKAFRSLASKHHPDKGGDTAEFQKIQEAYAKLSDVDKKAAYDNPSPFGNAPGGGWRQADFGSADGFEHFFSQFGDIFGQQRRQQTLRNRDINLATDISLEDAFTGKEILASYRLGNNEERTFEVKIPAGVQDGMVLKIRGAGDNTHRHLPPGDAMLTVNIKQHPKFQRNGNDIIEQVLVNAFDAILGKDLEIETIGKTKLTIKLKEGTQSDTILRAQGYGMPDVRNPSVFGNHMVVIKIMIPTNLTEFQKTTLKSILP